jgi:hypothetical protein
MQNAGWNVSISQFDMPDWKETAPPVLEQIAPTPKTKRYRFKYQGHPDARTR